MTTSKKSIKKSTPFQLRPVRVFSEEFKKTKVQELEKNLTTIAEIVSLYGVSKPSVYRWIHQYSTTCPKGTKQVIEMESEAQKTLHYKQQVADLQRIVGIKQIEIDYLTRLITLASDELGVDIKKTFSTPRLTGSERTNQTTTSNL
jgi:transposase-like protein